MNVVDTTGLLIRNYRRLILRYTPSATHREAQQDYQESEASLGLHNEMTSQEKRKETINERKARRRENRRGKGVRGKGGA